MLLYQYVENTIANRDLVALAAENEDDANKLMNQFRERMNLRTNVISTRLNDSMQNNYSPDENELEYFNKYKKEYDFKGYLSEMFTAPDSIKAYLCRQYSLHKIPILPQNRRLPARHL